MDIKQKLLQIVEDGMQDIWSKMYDELEKETNKEYSGDLGLDATFELDDIQEHIVDMFLDNIENEYDEEDED